MAVWPSILQAVSAVLLFSVSDALAKLLRASLPAVEIAWLRYLTFTGFAIVLVARGRFAGLWPKRPGLQALRGVTLVGSTVFFITGLSQLQIAEASAISFVSPHSSRPCPFRSLARPWASGAGPRCWPGLRAC